MCLLFLSDVHEIANGGLDAAGFPDPLIVIGEDIIEFIFSMLVRWCVGLQVSN